MGGCVLGVSAYSSMADKSSVCEVFRQSCRGHFPVFRNVHWRLAVSSSYDLQYEQVSVLQMHIDQSFTLIVHYYFLQTNQSIFGFVRYRVLKSKADEIIR